MATRTDKNGTVWEVDAQGNPIRPVAQGGGQYGPDPVKVRQQQMQEEDQQMQREAAMRAAQAAERANSNSAQSNAISAQNAALQQQKFQAELAQKGLMVGPDGQIVANPNIAGKASKDPIDPQKLANLRALEQQIVDVRAMYKDGFEGGGILDSLGEMFLPSQQNAAFDSAGTALAETGFGAFRTPGAGSQSDAEGQRFVDAYAPKSSDFDSKIEQKLSNLESRLRATYEAMGIEPQVLGQKPPPQKRDETPAIGGMNKSTNPFSNPNGPAPKPQKELGTDKEYTTDQDQAIADRLSKLWRSGASYDRLMQEYDAINREYFSGPEYAFAQGKFYKPSVSPVELMKQATMTGSKRPGFSPVPTGKRSDMQIGFNKAVTWEDPYLGISPGAIALSALNGTSFGALEAAAPEAYSQIRETNPMSALAGDVGGMIGGTAAIAKAGQSAAKRFAPGLLGGGKKAALARSIAPDAAYGAAYGGITQGDPLTGAVYATGGNLAGRGIAKGIGGIAKGVDDPAVQYLTQRDIPLSVGQTLGNRGVVGRTMNKLESLPVVGDLMARQRVQGLQAFEREALNDVLQPIGARVTQGGAEGLEQAQGTVSDAYGNALRGVNIPGDEQFVQEAGEALARGSAIPDLGPKFRYAVDNRVGPMFEGGTLSGPELQQALQNLGSIRSSFAKEGPMGQFAADATGQIDAALTGLVGRQAPDVMPQYNAAKGAFSRLAPFENARISGINQEAITPAQLSRAVTSNTKNFGGRAAAARGGNLSDLMKYGQEVLPSTVPNSGTADRLGGMGTMLLPTALGGSAYGLSTMTDKPEVAIPLAALAALSTKTGQKAFQAAATKRPKAIRRASSLIGRREAQKGLGGLVTAPLLVEDY